MPRIVVIGLGTFGRRLAVALSERGNEVIAVDKDAELVQEIKDEVTHAICLDSTEERVLKAQGLDDVDVVVVSVGNPEANELTTLIFKKNLNVRKVVARAANELHAKILNLIGADEVIFPEEESARMLAIRLSNPSLTSVIELSPDCSVGEFTVPRGFDAKSLAELKIRDRFNLNVVAIRRKVTVEREDGSTVVEEQVNNLPSGADMVQPNDVLVIVGRIEDLAEFSLEL